MSNARKYGADEIEQIFALATQTDAPSKPSVPVTEGLTLAELQEIGAEVDLHPDQIAAAARSLAIGGASVPRRTELGMPISVGRSVELPRAPTDREWDLLVSELRETFDARGEVSVDGSLREWRNSNLFASIEPTENGYRLRMGTKKGSALAMNRMALGGVVFGLLMSIVVTVAEGFQDGLLLAGLFWGMAAAVLGANLLTLPRWAGEREEQMDHIAWRARTLIGGPAEESRE